MAKKEKKEKVVYIDDGRTIADMSALAPGKGKAPACESESGSRFRDIWNTYWAATKMMLLPTLAVSGAMVVLFAVMYLIFSLA